jgi:hypothetical protein
MRFDITKPDGQSTATVHCRSIEHVTDKRKRRNSIARAAGFPPPIIKSQEDPNSFRSSFYYTDRN